MTIEKEFAADLDHALGVAEKEHEIKFSKLRRMLGEHGAVESAKRLLSTNRISDGFVNLASVGRLDLSIEHLAASPKYQSLFSAHEIAIAKKKLG